MTLGGVYESSTGKHTTDHTATNINKVPTLI